MELPDFIEKRPYLYHLTDQDNLDAICQSRRILSTQKIAEIAFDSDEDLSGFLESKRNDHVVLEANGNRFKIRDQKPISLTVLGRSLTDGWTSSDFILTLNSRVFMWPTLDRLYRHFNRYENENPVIIRVQTSVMLELHPEAEFCRLNSGATRCHPSYGGNAPTRGEGTFVTSVNYDDNIQSVAEVTFVEECSLPEIIHVANHPDGPWQERQL